MASPEGDFGCPNIKVEMGPDGSSLKTKFVTIRQGTEVSLPVSSTVSAIISCSECPLLTSLFSSGSLEVSGATMDSGTLIVSARQNAQLNFNRATRGFVAQNCVRKQIQPLTPQAL